MSVDTSASTRPARSRLRRSTAFLAAGVAVAALALAAPLAANAAPTATVTTNVATASGGGYVTLTAAGFQAGEALTVTLDGAPVNEYVENSGTQDVADSSGAYVTDAYIPVGTAVAPHTITVTGATTGPASTLLTVIPNPTGTANPASVQLSAYLSTGVTATFTGFPAGATIEFGIASPGMGNGIGTVKADSSGVATYTYVPTAGDGFDAVGTYAITAATAADNIVGGVQFTVTANAVAPAAPVADPAAPVAAPATPVKKTASFTG